MYQALLIGFVTIVFALPILVAVLIRQNEMAKSKIENHFHQQQELLQQHQQQQDSVEDTPIVEKLTALLAARQLDPPPATATEAGEMEGHDFWKEHNQLLDYAWAEWAQTNGLPELVESEMIDPDLFEAVSQMWKTPTQEKEDVIQDLLHEVIPGVYSFQLLNPNKVHYIRKQLDAINDSGIPCRRPNGMNRHGIVVDQTTEGGVSYPQLDAFRDYVVEKYMRPLARTCFNEYVGPNDDKEAYAFTISYKSGEDTQLKEHSDASTVSMNLNLNLPDEDYEGSTLVFIDDEEVRHEVRFEPGMALLHRGLHRHAALPLKDGERHNMVLWLFGENGYVRIAKYDEEERANLMQRWSLEAIETSTF